MILIKSLAAIGSGTRWFQNDQMGSSESWTLLSIVLIFIFLNYLGCVVDAGIYLSLLGKVSWPICVYVAYACLRVIRCSCLSWVLGESRCTLESTGVCMYAYALARADGLRIRQLGIKSWTRSKSSWVQGFITYYVNVNWGNYSPQ